MIGHVRRNAVAYLALFVALGGTATAATLARNSVGNAQLKSNAVTSAKVKNGSLRAVDFRSGDLPRGATGPQGPTGPAGPAGPAGAAGASLWAILRADGTIVRSSAGVTATRIDAGRYGVRFARSVVDCAEAAQLGGFTLGGEVQQPSAGYASAGVLSSGTEASDATVRVHTYGPDGSLADRAFHVVVLC